MSALALAYFYAADNFFFSTRYMAPIFQYLLVMEDSKTAWLTLGVCIVAAAWANPRPCLKIVDWLGSHVAITTLTVIAAFALGTVFIYHDAAFSMDEYAAVFQAKVFASGRLAAPLPPSVVDWLIPPGFNGIFLVASRMTGMTIEAYWPGFAALLAPFEFLRAPWLCNATLAGLAIFLIHGITLQITGDRRAAGWAMLFTLASGAFVANAISYYSMQAHLTANLLFAWLLMRPTPFRLIGAGAVGSLALVLHNPFPHAMFAVPWIVAIAFSKERRRSLLLLAIGYMPILIFVGAGWLHLRSVITAGNSGFNVISNGFTSVFSIPDKAMIDMRTAALVKMWVWASPCLFLFALMGRLHHGDDQRVRLLMQSAIVTFVSYVFVVFDQGHGWGYRYFHSAWGVVPILAGCAMTGRSESNGRLLAFAGAGAILNLLIVVPFQMAQIDGIITRHTAELPGVHRPGNDVYFVRWPSAFYIADLVQTDPLLREEDLVLFSRGPELDAELRRQNWPNAVLVDRGFGVEEWNLGATDQRRVDSSGIKRFEFAYTEHAPRDSPPP